jgi:ribosome-binding protein aMBF1 (putative translation factor)
MDINNKKEDILQHLQFTKDEQLIEDVYQLVHADEEIKNISISELPEELQNKISGALEDYKNGRYITHEQMKEKVSQWLTS